VLSSLILGTETEHMSAAFRLTLKNRVGNDAEILEDAEIEKLLRT